MTDSFQRYLRAKRTVDDRALDRRVVDRLREGLATRAAECDGPLRILEIGAGIGTMVTRMIDWEILPPMAIEYTAVDIQAENITTLPEYCRGWAADRDVAVSGSDSLVLDSGDRHVEIDPVVGDGTEYASQAEGYDCLVGAALLDILDLDGLETLLGTLDAGGLAYFPITFDGATRFRPTHPADREIVGQYHAHMDHKPGGSSRAGGDVLARLQAMAGVRIEAVAGSDWIVRPVEGSYPGDETAFLRWILDSVEDAVGEITDGLDGRLDDWVACRREQVDACELSYHTHQLDLLARVDAQ